VDANAGTPALSGPAAPGASGPAIAGDGTAGGFPPGGHASTGSVNVSPLGSNADSFPVGILPPSAPAGPNDLSQIGQVLDRMPLMFEANVGQADPSVKFLSRVGGAELLLSPTEATFVLPPPWRHATSRPDEPVRPG
jgi:hypothetical protein